MTVIAIEYQDLTASKWRRARAFDTDTETVFALGPYGNNPVTTQAGCCAVSCSGLYLAIAGAANSDPDLRVVRISDGVVIFSYTTSGGWIGAVSFSRDGLSLFFTVRNANLYRMDLATGVSTAIVPAGTGICGMTVSKFDSGQNLLAFYAGTQVVVLDMSTYVDIGLVASPSPSSPNNSAVLALSPGGRYLCVLPAPGLFRSVHVYSLANKILAADLSSITTTASDATFTQGDRYLLLACGSQGLVVVDTATWAVMMVIGAGTPISFVCMSTDFTQAYVWNASSNSAGVVDVATWTITYPGSLSIASGYVGMLRSQAGNHSRLLPESAAQFWTHYKNAFESV